MKGSRIVKVFLVLAVVVSLIGCSATPTRRSFKEGWKDSVVSTKVKFKLTSDKLVKKRNIDVDTWRGVVTLTGRVTSMSEKERAEQIAWQVAGVRGVDNFLKQVEDASSLGTGEVVAEKTPQATKIEPIAKKTAGHPAKQVVVKETTDEVVETKVNNKVGGPVIFEEEVKTTDKLTAKRGRYQKPDSSQIKEEDLTTEQDLARDAAEELKRLRGEEEPAE